MSDILESALKQLTSKLERFREKVYSVLLVAPEGYASLDAFADDFYAIDEDCKDPRDIARDFHYFSLLDFLKSDYMKNHVRLEYKENGAMNFFAKPNELTLPIMNDILADKEEGRRRFREEDRRRFREEAWRQSQKHTFYRCRSDSPNTSTSIEDVDSDGWS